MYFDKNMSFWKVWLKTDSIAVLGAFFYIGQHVAKLIFDIFGKIIFCSVFKTLTLKNSFKLSFSGFGSIKKLFLMVKSCLEHISKLILIGKSLANYLYMQIQGCHFLKSALNLDLTLSDDGKCPALLIYSGIIDLGAFCVELWSFFVSKRISVPM